MRLQIVIMSDTHLSQWVNYAGEVEAKPSMAFLGGDDDMWRLVMCVAKYAALHAPRGSTTNVAVR